MIVMIISYHLVYLLNCLVINRLYVMLRSFCHEDLSSIFLIGLMSLHSCFLSFGSSLRYFKFSCSLSLLLLLVSCFHSLMLRFDLNVAFLGFISMSGSCNRILILILILIYDVIFISNSNRFLNVLSIHEAFQSRTRSICSI